MLFLIHKFLPAYQGLGYVTPILNILSIFHVITVCTSENVSNYIFDYYMKKFRPSEVWEKIEISARRDGLNTTVKEAFDEIYKGIDQTDELLRLKVKNGDPKVIIQEDGRRWRPPPDMLNNVPHDRFSLRRRFLELMKQAIYQTRNKMVIMQNMRDKYRGVSLYKMGFLMSKTDIACKKFSSIAYKAFKICTLQRQDAIRQYYFRNMIETEERLLSLWFDIDLLRDLITINDENCKRMLNQVLSNRKQAWKFVD